jgi:restriction system protein
MRGLQSVVTLFLLAMAALSAFRSWKTGAMLEQQTSLESIRRLPWKRFEDLLGEAYRRQGYEVKETLGGGADGGVDLVLGRDGNVALVQCKRWNGKPVPVQTVRELYGILHDRGASSAKLVATTNFTSDAIAFAKGKPIELINAEGVLQLIRNVQTSGNIPVAVEREGNHLAPDCPRCGAEMTVREARRGPNPGQRFWGCSNYPRTKCRGARTI